MIKVETLREMMAIRGFLNAKRVIGFGIRYGLPSWI